jgi:hypothetical protein
LTGATLPLAWKDTAMNNKFGSNVAVAFAGFPASAFPMTVELLPMTSADLPALWSITIEGPGALNVPRMPDEVWVRVTFSDGTQVEEGRPA